jgi:transcriptional regulator EpsA
MNQARRLSDIDRDRFSDAVEASLGVATRPQFFRWTQSDLLSLIPHEILICGIEDGSRGGLSMHHFSASRYFRQEQFDSIADPLTGLLPIVMAEAESSRPAIIYSPQPGAREDDSALRILVESNELKNLAMHLVWGARGKCDAFYAFSRLPVNLDQQLAYLIELVAPHLHSAFLRVLAMEREASVSPSQRAGRIVTPRQHEILSLIKAGKTNAEIAGLLSCSQWTIKNHVQAILRKLDSNTRSHAIARAMSLGILSPD